MDKEENEVEKEARMDLNLEAMRGENDNKA
jgi:hypothetical protein